MVTDQSVIEQLFQSTQGSINISLIIILLALGYLLKHMVKKLNNDSIPYIMLIAGIILALIINIPYGTDKIVELIIQGIVSGAAAVGLHTNGKGLLQIFNFGSASSSSEE